MNKFLALVFVSSSQLYFIQKSAYFTKTVNSNNKIPFRQTDTHLFDHLNMNQE